jgi:hypothetical protein
VSQSRSSSPQCHVGDKDPIVCQSDDQFFVWDYAIKHGWLAGLHRSRSHPDAHTVLTVRELDLWGAPPFDVELHQLAERLRNA